jgi:trigger factor
MSVVVSIEDVSSCEKQVRIEVPEPAVEAELRRTEQEYRRQATMPGFRKGKAPAELIRRKYRREIEEDVLERLVPRYWEQARAEEELDPLMPPQVEDVSLQDTKLSFTALVEVRPDVRVDRLDGLELPEPPGEPDEADVDRAIDDLRRQAGDWSQVERAAGQGDRVTARIIEITAGEPAEDADPPEPVSFEIGDPNLWEELSLAATGRAAGQKGEFERTDSEGETERKRRFRFEVETVEERVLPDLDDAFAQQVGDFETVDDLRAEVRKQLTAALQRESRSQRERAALQQLRDRYPLELPARVVEHEVEHMARDWAGDMARRGVDMQKTQVDWKALYEDMKPQAERNVHSRLLLDAAIEQHGIEVDASELEQALGDIGRAEGTSAAVVRQRLDRSGQLADLERQLQRRRLLDRMLGEQGAAESTDEERESKTADETAEG